MNSALFKDLTDEQLAKAKACKNSDELLELAKREGYTLTDEQLAAVSGGCGGSDPKHVCPVCGATVEGEFLYRKSKQGPVYSFKCPACGHLWTEIID